MVECWVAHLGYKKADMTALKKGGSMAEMKACQTDIKMVVTKER